MPDMGFTDPGNIALEEATSSGALGPALSPGTDTLDMSPEAMRPSISPTPGVTPEDQVSFEHKQRENDPAVIDMNPPVDLNYETKDHPGTQKFLQNTANANKAQDSAKELTLR